MCASCFFLLYPFRPLRERHLANRDVHMYFTSYIYILHTVSTDMMLLYLQCVRVCQPVRICFFPSYVCVSTVFFKGLPIRSSESFLEEILRSLHIFSAWSPWYVVDYVANDFSYLVRIISPSADWHTHFLLLPPSVCTDHARKYFYPFIHWIALCMCRSAHSHAPHYQLKFL